MEIRLFCWLVHFIHLAEFHLVITDNDSFIFCHPFLKYIRLRLQKRPSFISTDFDIFRILYHLWFQDFIPCLYTLFVTFGENHLLVLTNTLKSENRDSFLRLLCIILQCSGAPGHYPKDEVYSIQTFNFWYQLQVSMTPLKLSIFLYSY